MDSRYNNSNRLSKRTYLYDLRKIFADREREVRERVRSRHAPHIEFLNKRGIALENLREVSSRKIAAGALAGALIFNPVSTTIAAPHHQTVAKPTELAPPPEQLSQIVGVEDTGLKMSQALKSVVPAGSSDLSAGQEAAVSRAIAGSLGIKASAELGGHRLNRSFGLIGAEQHLYRYPGDNVLDQLQTPGDFAKYGGAGIAPHTGAYGYFAPSKAALTPNEADLEKWYVVAQTFLAPGFNQNSNGTAQFFKYRKFIVINPDSGQAVVGDLADAGPAEYTGKSFGGSPEVMDYLGYGAGSRKGRVVFFMVDDPNNQLPLGPITKPVSSK